METQELKRIVEALIFAADEPLSADRIAETLELQNGFDLGVLIEELNRDYHDSGRAFTIRKVAGGYQIVTQQNYASWIRKLYLGRQKNRLSHAALETLALIAFKQPISRVDIAQIRGVNSDGVIGTLLERKLITISGRSDTVGRPLLYSTTPEFLKYFGINDIADLPKPREIEELFSKEGMPEELLQALSQTDAQLSLPINIDGETPGPAEEAESKTETPALPQLPTAEVPSVVDSSNEPSEPATISASIENPTARQEIAASSIDINEQVVTQLEVSDDSDAKVISSPPANAGQHEIAWISLNGEANKPVEDFTGAELALEELIETENDLPTFAGVTEVVSETLRGEESSGAEAKSSSIATMMEEITADFVRTDEVAGSGEGLGPEAVVAEVDEIVEMIAASPSVEVKVVEVHGPQAPDEESPPLALQADRDEDIDGWMAEEFSQEEIAEPDFVKKSDDFFLEDVTVVEFDEPKAVESAGSVTFGETQTDAASTAQPQSTPAVANDAQRTMTWRERVASWIRRAVNKLMTFIDAKF
jgi:segregation and condensation protein B